MGGIRRTPHVVAMLREFLAEPDRRWFGSELADEVGFPAGTAYPILRRLEGVGWLRSEWEAVDPSEVGRAARNYYVLTPAGVDHAAAFVAGARPIRPFGVTADR